MANFPEHFERQYQSHLKHEWHLPESVTRTEKADHPAGAAVQFDFLRT